MIPTLPYYSEWQPLPWATAPAWAHYAAQDATGKWFWYEQEPKDEDGYFSATGRVAELEHGPYPGHWRMSLCRRPNYETMATAGGVVFQYQGLEIRYGQVSA